MTESRPARSSHAAVADPMHASDYRKYLLDRGYAPGYVQSCEAAARQFSAWMRRPNEQTAELGEALVAEYLDALREPRRGSSMCRRDGARSALVHFLAALRATGAIAPKALDATSVGEELRAFDRHMVEARGLATSTRKNALRIVERLLRKHFTGHTVEFDTITPEHVRAFFAEQAKLYTAPASIGTVVGALRGYFRWRSAQGDHTHALLGAVSCGPTWKLTSLPQSLTPCEVELLVAALELPAPYMLRSRAMVRCALDLGLRRGEVARLSLDDIDWGAGTVTLRRTKGRRDDVMPLPLATGHAIASYLRNERPKTIHRMVFASHQAPYDRPLCATVVGTTIRNAYARAGLTHTRPHLLRHTMASRLLASGSSLKEVADVLRHRSLNATRVYAKLDSHRLVAVALPWPGCPGAVADGRRA